MTKPALAIFWSSFVMVSVGCKPANLAHLDDPIATREAQGFQDEVATREPVQTEVQNAAMKRPKKSILTLDQNRYEVPKDRAQVWDAMIENLIQNYNLIVVDRESGVLTTEWDTFYLDNVVYRNKVTVRVRPQSRVSTIVMMHNKIERLSDAVPGSENGGIWVPAEDVGKETNRLVNNLALRLDVQGPASASRTAAFEPK